MEDINKFFLNYNEEYVKKGNRATVSISWIGEQKLRKKWDFVQLVEALWKVKVDGNQVGVDYFCRVLLKLKWHDNMNMYQE